MDIWEGSCLILTLLLQFHCRLNALDAIGNASTKPHIVSALFRRELLEAIRQTLKKTSTQPRIFIQESADWHPKPNEPGMGMVLPFGHAECRGSYPCM